MSEGTCVEPGSGAKSHLFTILEVSRPDLFILYPKECLDVPIRATRQKLLVEVLIESTLDVYIRCQKEYLLGLVDS